MGTYRIVSDWADASLEDLVDDALYEGLQDSIRTELGAIVKDVKVVEEVGPTGWPEVEITLVGDRKLIVDHLESLGYEGEMVEKID